MSIFPANIRRQFTRISCFAVAVLLMSMVSTETANAQSPNSGAPSFAAFVIVNPTNVPLEYQVQWGNRGWKNFKIKAKGVATHYTNLDENGHAPYRWVKFDKVGGDGRFTGQTYKVGFYATDVIQKGKVYYFKFKGNNLDLHYANASDEREFHNSLRHNSDSTWNYRILGNWK